MSQAEASRSDPWTSFIPARSGGWAFAIAVLALGWLLLSACSSSPAEVSPTPVSVASPVPTPTKGREIFVTNCAACHGVDAAGQPDWHIANADGTLPPPPLNGDGHTWHHGDGLLYRVVKLGGQQFEDPRFPDFKSAMPAFGEQLSHEDIVEVLTYIKSLWEDKTSRGLSIQEAQALASEVDPFPPSGE